MEFVRKKVRSASIIMAIGVGGGGGNAVNHLYSHGERNISFMLCNTDRQALINSPVSDSTKVLLGKDGLGAGNQAAVGRAHALESIDQVKNLLVEMGIKMAFVVAGMGGGTGTGAAPVIASLARELGILTIGVVTIPFEAEGRPRLAQAVAGVDELSKNVDSLIIINNANIAQIYGDLPLSKAYFKSNEIISKAVKSISDIITKNFVVNVDFADVCRVMSNSGVALMGTGVASGPNRALEATKQALSSPLLHMQDIRGSKNVLVCITSSSKLEHELKMSDSRDVPAYIQKQTCTQNETDIIWGAGYDDSLDDKLQVIVIATGFSLKNIPSMRSYYGLEEMNTYESSSTTVKNNSAKISLDGNGVTTATMAKREPLKPVRLSYRNTQVPDSHKHEVEVTAPEANNIVIDEKVDEPQSVATSDSVPFFYDMEDSRPAFQRRKYKIGTNSHNGKKKESLKMDDEKSKTLKEPVMTTGSLFDDI